jgi:uncharacterized protein YggT (Ycf19 family)
MRFLCIGIEAYILICFARVALSFIGDVGNGSVLATLTQLCTLVTEPIFGAVRSKMPQIGDLPIDFSPAVVILVCVVAREIVCAL